MYRAVYFDNNKSSYKLKLCDICEEDNSRQLLTSCAHSTHQKVQCILLAIFVRKHIIRTIIGLAYFEVFTLLQSQNKKLHYNVLPICKTSSPRATDMGKCRLYLKEGCRQKTGITYSQVTTSRASTLILALNTSTSTSSTHVCSLPCWVNLFLRALNT